MEDFVVITPQYYHVAITAIATEGFYFDNILEHENPVRMGWRNSQKMGGGRMTTVWLGRRRR